MLSSDEERVRQAIQELLDNLAPGRFRCIERKSSAVLDSLIEAGGGNALYDVSQAISATANKVNGEKAYELRRLAVDIL